jgi:hypothetical protein
MPVRACCGDQFGQAAFGLADQADQEVDHDGVVAEPRVSPVGQRGEGLVENVEGVGVGAGGGGSWSWRGFLGAGPAGPGGAGGAEPVGAGAVWMMWASNVSRSTTAAASRGSVKVAPHSENGALDAYAMDAFPSRPVMIWNSSSAPRGSRLT